MYKKKTIRIGLIILIIFVIIALVVKRFNLIQVQKTEPASMEGNSCITKVETRTVQGGSMVGLIDEGKAIKILDGYYDCNPVQRGDVVAFHYAGDSNPIIKAVRGLPGDSFSIVPSNDAIKHQIMVNNQSLANNSNQPYLLDDQETKMLELYEKNYQNKIPPNTYLILGNITYGSIDSTRFGLVGKNDIIGKIIY